MGLRGLTRFLWDCLSDLPHRWVGPGAPTSRSPQPACCGARSSGRRPRGSPAAARAAGLGRDLGPQRHTLPPSLSPWPGPGLSVSVPPPGHSPSQDRAIVSVPPPSALGRRRQAHLPISCPVGSSACARVTSTTMYKATAAAAALPPVQKKPNLFHILINLCEFLIDSRAVSWEPELPHSEAGTEKRLVTIGCCCGYHCVPGRGGAAVSKAPCTCHRLVSNT